MVFNITLSGPLSWLDRSRVPPIFEPAIAQDNAARMCMANDGSPRHTERREREATVSLCKQSRLPARYQRTGRSSESNEKDFAERY